MLDCGGRDEPIPNDLLANLDYISPNETELERLIGEKLNTDDKIENLVAIIKNKLLSKHS